MTTIRLLPNFDVLAKAAFLQYFLEILYNYITLHMKMRKHYHETNASEFLEISRMFLLIVVYKLRIRDNRNMIITNTYLQKVKLWMVVYDKTT